MTPGVGHACDDGDVTMDARESDEMLRLRWNPVLGELVTEEAVEERPGGAEAANDDAAAAATAPAFGELACPLVGSGGYAAWLRACCSGGGELGM